MSIDSPTLHDHKNHTTNIKVTKVAVDLEEIKAKLELVQKGTRYEINANRLMTDKEAKDIIQNKLYLIESCLIKIEKEIL